MCRCDYDCNYGWESDLEEDYESDYVYENENGVATQPCNPNTMGCQCVCVCPGPRGFTGPAGPMGLPGPRGFTGVTGPMGPRGPRGFTGATGPVGAPGAAGATGATGPVGARGPVGSTGATGPAGATGATGSTGPIGPVGPAGAVGPIGPVGPTVTAQSIFAANLSGGPINLAVGGTLVPLPQQDLGSFTSDITKTTFTVPTTGRYYLTYDVNLATGVALNTQILVNGVAIPESVRNSSTRGVYSASFIRTLQAGDLVALDLSGIAVTVQLQNGVGASLTIIKLS